LVDIKDNKIIQKIPYNNNYSIRHKEHNRYIMVNNELFYHIGRWIGDGWIRKSKNGSYEVGMAFHSNDESGINKYKYFLNENNFSFYENKAKNKQLTQIIVRSYVLFNLYKTIVYDYNF